MQYVNDVEIMDIQFAVEEVCMAASLVVNIKSGSLQSVQAFSGFDNWQRRRHSAAKQLRRFVPEIVQRPPESVRRS
jgi:hypothetical protein